MSDMTGTISTVDVTVIPGSRKRIHVCPVCGKALTSRWKLERHERIHTGDRPFACAVCDKRFIEKSKLKAHMINHVPYDFI